MNLRKCKDGSHRLRIYHAHEDQIETIQLALDHARSELGTEFDSVALDAICTNYLSGGSVTKPSSVVDVLKRYSVEEILEAVDALPNE
jgi:hypothetical protein